MRFDMTCGANDVEYRLTKLNHPWTNGEVERMSRTITNATSERFHYESQRQLPTHLADFTAAYNSARRLTTLKAGDVAGMRGFSGDYGYAGCYRP